MPCYRPVRAFQGVHSGVVGVEFRRSRARAEPIDLPCGRCPGCLLERSRQWAMRCVHEAQLHEENCFVTLTYRDECNPGVLVKKHFQDFMKRLRKWGPHHFDDKGRRVSDIRYFHCGEYGEKFSRPHYHALLFGINFHDRQAWKGDLYTSQILERIWKMGFCSVGAVTFESAGYVARYAYKKAARQQVEGHSGALDVQTGELVAEYVCMSLKPGIGAGWYDKFKSDMYPAGSCVLRGRDMRSPRYYDKLFELEDPKTMRRIVRARARAAKPEDNTPERLHVREVVKVAQVGLLKRSLENKHES